MKIIVDAMGGDNAPLEVLKGIEEALKEFTDCSVLIVGDEKLIKEIAEKNEISLDRTEIHDCKEYITMEDHAGSVMREKSNSTMSVGLKLLSEGKGDAFMSAGNSGALVVGATLIVKRIKGIKRPAFAPVMPKSDGMFMLIDGGANVDCQPEMLKHFALLASIYMEKVMGVKNPRVGLANVGTEDHKGGDLQHKAFELLKESSINFIGNIEARDIPYDACDVVVADGFTGNVIVKLYEGVAMALMDKIKGVFTKNLKTKLAAALVLSDMKELKKSMDYNEYGGAPVLGVRKPVFKVHGSAKAKTFKNAFKLTRQYVLSDVVGKVTEALEGMSSNEE